jgi:hypothetical protein
MNTPDLHIINPTHPTLFSLHTPNDIWVSRTDDKTGVFTNSRFPSYSIKVKTTSEEPVVTPSMVGIRDNEINVETITWLLSNLYRVAREDMWLRLSLKKDYYTGTGISYNNLRTILSYLAGNGDIISVKGYKDAGRKYGLVSAFRFTTDSPVYKALCEQASRKALVYEARVIKNAVVVKDGKNIVSVHDSQAILDLLERDTQIITSYNNMMKSHDVTVRLESVVDPYLKALADENNINHLLSLRSIYNDSNCTTGGRCYSLVQNVKKEERANILIDGEATVELDFAQLHPTMLAHINGVTDTSVDIYSICTVLGVSRSHSKNIINRAFNATVPMKSLKFAIADMGYDRNEVDANAYYELLIEKAPHLKSAFSSPQTGLRLMKLDSDICKNVLAMCVMNDIPVIPVHDSFICKKSDMEQVYNMMVASYKVVMAANNVANYQDCVCDIKAK